MIGVALALLVQTRLLRQARETHVAEDRRLERLTRQHQAALAQRTENTAALREAAEKLTALQVAAAANAERELQVRTWRTRIERIQQRLDEMPGEKIPELKMLGMKDWIEAVLSAETATDVQARRIFASLRSHARAKFATQLLDALTQFTDASGGQLPSSLLDLQSYLTPPADSDMLAGYTLRRTGSVGASDEELIRTEGPAGETVSITLKGYSVDGSYTAGAILPDKVGNSNVADLDDSSGHLFTNFSGAVEKISPMLDQVFEPLDKKAFGERMHEATKAYMAANAGRAPANFEELRPFFPEADQLAESLVPVIAYFDYVLDHGVAPENADVLRRYLARHGTTAKIQRMMKITMDGEHGSMNFELK